MNSGTLSDIAPEALSQAATSITPEEMTRLPEGWFSSHDVAAYRSLCESLPREARMAELGVWQGRSLCSVAEVVRRRMLQVHAVDTFCGTLGDDLVHDCDGRLRDRFVSNLNRFAIAQQVTIHLGSTISIASHFEPACLDMVFIDADHKYESVVADIWAWMPKVKPGGILCGHDYRRPGDDVNRAVDELLGSDRITLLGRTAIWCLRLPN